MKAILFKIGKEWILEVLSEFAWSKAFHTAKAAREFARRKGMAVKRGPNCDSEED